MKPEPIHTVPWKPYLWSRLSINTKIDIRNMSSKVEQKIIIKYERPKYIYCYVTCVYVHMKIESLPVSNIHTLTGRCTSRPISCSLTSASTVSHQGVACVTTVGGCLSECCSRSESKTAIGWISQIATVHNYQDEENNM